jgi:addiction module RelE/StbE family toxin
MNLRWTSNFKRTLKKIIRQTPQKKERFFNTLILLKQDPFQPKLHTHKLKGELQECWACYVEFDTRIVFTFVENPTSASREILLLDIGSHDEVY